MPHLIPATELQPYFDAILAAPEDDEPRLALARFLTERGDGRGEHIRLSIELAALAEDDPAHLALKQRLATLPSFMFFDLTGRPNMPGSFRVRRGFLEELECSVENFIVHGEWLFANAPIRVWAPMHLYGNGERLARCPALAKLRKLDIQTTDTAARAVLLASPHLVGLRELALSIQLPDRLSVVKLGWELRGLRGLRSLTFKSGTIDGSAVTALAALARLLRLEHLGVYANMPDLGLTKLRVLLGTERVAPRPTPPFTFRFGVLDISDRKLGAGDVQKLIDRENVRSATKVRLSGTRIGDAGLVHLARSGAFPSVVELSLDDIGMTDDGIRSFAREAIGLDRLERVSLGDMRNGIGDAAVEELARSPRLPALRTIMRSWEHRPYTESERTEVVQLRGHDERIVESIIEHWIFP